LRAPHDPQKIMLASDYRNLAWQQIQKIENSTRIDLSLNVAG